MITSSFCLAVCMQKIFGDQALTATFLGVHSVTADDYFFFFFGGVYAKELLCPTP